MKNILKLTAVMLFAVLASCKKDAKVADMPTDLNQYYVAGKFSYQEGPAIPFAFIPSSPTKGLFVYLGEQEDVDYTFENNQLSTTISGAKFTCDIKGGKVENIIVNSAVLDIVAAVLNKKQDPALAFTGKRFESPLKKLDGTVVYDQYYFEFNADPQQLIYKSNPVSGSYLIFAKSYELLVDGCFHNEDTDTFAVMMNGKLELETKIGNDYVLFSGTKK